MEKKKHVAAHKLKIFSHLNQNEKKNLFKELSDENLGRGEEGWCVKRRTIKMQMSSQCCLMTTTYLSRYLQSLLAYFFPLRIAETFMETLSSRRTMMNDATTETQQKTV